MAQPRRTEITDTEWAISYPLLPRKRNQHYRAIATRYDNQDANFLASVKLAAIRI